MAQAKSRNMIGSWAFLIGVVLAVVLGLVGSTNETWILILVLIGLIVGFLNIAANEAEPFLLSGAVLIIASGLGGSVMESVPVINEVLLALLAIFVPATIIVAIRNVFSLARR